MKLKWITLIWIELVLKVVIGDHIIKVEKLKNVKIKIIIVKEDLMLEMIYVKKD